MSTSVPTAAPGVTPGSGGVMTGGGSGAAAADTVGRHTPASAAITAMDDPARRRLHLSVGPASLAEAPARPLSRNDRIVRAPFHRKTVHRRPPGSWQMGVRLAQIPEPPGIPAGTGRCWISTRAGEAGGLQAPGD